MKNNKNTLDSVKCDVTSCVHNAEGKHCTAGSISVCRTCSDPGCADETLCKTFSARS